MKQPQTPQRFIGYLRTLPKRYVVYGVLGLAVLLYAVNFFIPRNVEFSYSGATCHRQITVFPAVNKSTDKGYDVSFKGGLRIGSTSLASTQTCFTVASAPNEGRRTIAVAPFGSFYARTHYSITTPKAPTPSLKSVKAEIPVSKKLNITMNQLDVIHDYDVSINDASAKCVPIKAAIECNVPALKLAQGQSYDYTVRRSFKGEEQVSVGSGTFKTLRAVTVTQASFTPNQIVFARPTELTITADKPLSAAMVELLLDGKPVAMDQSISGNALQLKLKAELPREKAYTLIIKSLEATDGSTQVEPYIVPFKTSGGPKVAKVSVGATGVAQSAAITLTFDQALSKTKDILSFISVAGGQATVKKISDTQVIIQLSGLPLCQAFTMTAKQGIVSEYDLPSAQAWTQNSRTVCYQTSTYGTSLRGRPLTAYIFGSTGPVTMYVGGIHGSESSSTNLLREWMNELEANPARYAAKRIVLVPAINPDGLATNSRTNSRGVNLNRNFPTDNWTKSIKDTDGNHPTGGGESPLSEPEAAALAKITSAYKPRLLLSFHAVGGLAIGDAGGYSAGYAAKYASMVGYRDGTNASSTNFDYNVTGSYEDWTYRNVGIPSIVVELTGYTSVNYTGHYSALWAMLN